MEGSCDRMPEETSRKQQIEEMTSIWSDGDEYARGYLNGIIEAVTHMAGRKETEPEPKAG